MHAIVRSIDCHQIPIFHGPRQIPIGFRGRLRPPAMINPSQYRSRMRLPEKRSKPSSAGRPRISSCPDNFFKCSGAEDFMTDTMGVTPNTGIQLTNRPTVLPVRLLPMRAKKLGETPRANAYVTSAWTRISSSMTKRISLLVFSSSDATNDYETVPVLRGDWISEPMY